MPFVDDGSVRTLWLCRCGRVTGGEPHECKPTCTECPAPDAPDDTRECEAADLYVHLAELIDERDAANARCQRAQDHARKWKATARIYRQQRDVAIASLADVRQGLSDATPIRSNLLQFTPIRSNCQQWPRVVRED